MKSMHVFYVYFRMNILTLYTLRATVYRQLPIRWENQMIMIRPETY